MSDMQTRYHYEQLIEIFNQCFSDDYNTRLAVSYTHLTLPTTNSV